MDLRATGLALVFAAVPAQADEGIAPPGGGAPPALEHPPEDGMDEGITLLEEGARLFFRGLMAEMEPAMRDMAEGMDDFVRGLEPMLRELARLMGDFSEYHPPEMLPNGDIIIRKKRPWEIGPGGETEI